MSTEPKQWATWQEVPEGVAFRSATDGDSWGVVWIREGVNVRSAELCRTVFTGNLNTALAPFIRAEVQQ